MRELVPERWLRHLAEDTPAVIGCSRVVSLPGSRTRLRPAGVANSLGWPDSHELYGDSPTAHPMVVSFMVGINLAGVFDAAQARARVDPDTRLVVVCPERDAVKSIRSLVNAVAGPTSLVTVPNGWRVELAAGSPSDSTGLSQTDPGNEHEG